MKPLLLEALYENMLMETEPSDFPGSSRDAAVGGEADSEDVRDEAGDGVNCQQQPG